jgi:hypothetical protein
VVALDVGYGQLAWEIRTDERVSVLERTNVRELTRAHLPYAPDLVVADLSFISLRLAVEALAGVSAEGGDHVLLVKPQFEAGSADVGRGGVVREAEVWRRAISGVVAACEAAGLAPQGVMASPLPSPAGNVEPAPRREGEITRNSTRCRDRRSASHRGAGETVGCHPPGRVLRDAAGSSSVARDAVGSATRRRADRGRGGRARVREGAGSRRLGRR